jgi:hypothetical protein
MKTNKMHKWYIFSQSVAPTGFGRAWPSNTMTCAFVQGVIVHKYIPPTRPSHSAHISTQDILNIYTESFNFSTLILIIYIPQDVWIVVNIFMNNYTLD